LFLLFDIQKSKSFSWVGLSMGFAPNTCPRLARPRAIRSCP